MNSPETWRMEGSKCCDRSEHWRRQLWGTCPSSTSNCLIFQVISEPHKLWHSTPRGCLSSKNYSLRFVPHSHQILATPLEASYNNRCYWFSRFSFRDWLISNRCCPILTRRKISTATDWTPFLCEESVFYSNVFLHSCCGCVRAKLHYTDNLLWACPLVVSVAGVRVVEFGSKPAFGHSVMF